MNQCQLTNNQALIAYGLTGAFAYAGWYNIVFIYIGMFLLFTIAVFLTLSGGI